MADMSATIVVEQKNWGQIVQEAKQIGVPDHARFTLHEYKSYTPIDYDQARITFSWTVNL